MESIKIEDIVEELKKVDDEFAELVDSEGNDIAINEMLYKGVKFPNDFQYEVVDVIRTREERQYEETKDVILKRKGDGKHFTIEIYDDGQAGGGYEISTIAVEVRLKKVEVIKWIKIN